MLQMLIYFNSFILIFVLQEQTYLKMFLSNQRNQNVFYYSPFHSANQLSTQISQPTTNFNNLHRIEAPNNSQKTRPQLDHNDKKFHFNTPDNSFHNYRAQQQNTNDSSHSRFNYQDFQNYENHSNQAPRNMYISPGKDKMHENKPTHLIKRKESSNNNFREFRQETGKNTHIIDFMNKFPQLDLNRNQITRQTHASPTVQFKVNEIKKINSTVHLHARTLSSKDNFQMKSPKGLDSSQQYQEKKNWKRQTITNVSSPGKQSLNQIIGNYPLSLDYFSQNPEKNTESRCSTKRQSTANSTSIMLESTQYKLNTEQVMNKGTNSFIEVSNKKKYLNTECQVNIEAQKSFEDIKLLKESLKKVERQLQQQKSQNHQLKISNKNLESQIILLKMTQERKVTIMQKQSQVKIQKEKQEARADYLTKLTTSTQQLQRKYEVDIEKLEQKYKKEMFKIKEQCQVKFKIELSQTKLGFDKKVAEESSLTKLLKEQNIRFIGKIKNLESELESMKKINYQANQQAKCANSLKFDLSRRVQQLKQIVGQKESKCRNYGKQLKNKDKHISELYRNMTTLNELIKGQSQEIIQIKFNALNQKYKNFGEEE